MDIKSWVHVERAGPPAAILPAMDAEGLLACELHCRHCWYNLRGLPAQGQACPECGYPVEASVDQYRRMWVDERWVASQVLGQVCIFLLVGWAIIAVVGMVAVQSRDGLQWAPAWELVSLAGFIFLLMLRRYFVTTPITFGDAHPDDRAQRIKGVLVESLAFVVAFVLGCAVAMGWDSPGEVIAWMELVVLGLAATWQQIVGAHGLRKVHGVLVVREANWRGLLGYVPVIPLIIGGFFYLGLLSKENEHFRALAIGVGAVIVFAPLTGMASLATPIWKIFEEAVWTRARARRAGEVPVGFGQQGVRVGWYQAWIVNRFAKAAEKNQGRATKRYERGEDVL